MSPAVGVAKVAQESAILSAVRRQMEAFEEKLGSQIVRVQQQGDRMRDAAFSRVDSKMGTIEGLQPKFDRKLAELSGNYKGLSDEMQAQIRRIDQMDTRLWEWRHQLEDEVHKKFAEIEQQYQQVASQIRLANATNDDSFKRCNNRMSRMDRQLEQVFADDTTNQALMSFELRLQDIESVRMQELALSAPESPTTSPDVVALKHAVDAAGEHANMVAISALEARLADACLKIVASAKESQELQTRVEAQEERLRSVRTMMDAKEEQYRSSKFDLHNWESRSKELSAQYQEMDRFRVEHGEKLDVIAKRFEHLENRQEEIADMARRMQHTAHNGEGGDGVVRRLEVSHAPLAFDATHLEEQVRDVGARICEVEGRVETLEGELQSEQQAARGDQELAPRVAALVESLKQVAPKVMDQELCMRELHEKVGHLEARAGLVGDGKAAENMTARLGRLEVEVTRLKTEIEGGEISSVNG